MKKYVKASSISSELEDVINWLADHDQAYSDCCDFFGVDDLYDLDDSAYNDLVSWIAEHDQLYEDYLVRHSKRDFRVYYRDGNQRLYEAPNIVELVSGLSDMDREYSLTISKIEEV